MEANYSLILKNRNKLINFGLIVLALIIAKNIYGYQIKKVNTLKAKKETELKKNALINNISGLEKRIEVYKKVFYKRDTSSIINNITIGKSLQKYFDSI